tara:strand:+ start:10405 stop:10683 length:279 start_codon:yes stop_codon:yes gene_type:complete
MVEGNLMVRENDRSMVIEQLHLLRTISATIQNLGQSFSKNPEPVDVLDIWQIPEIDKIIKKHRAKAEERFEQRAEQVLDKYKRIGEKYKDGG